VKTIELLRHTSNEGDVLTQDGIVAAIEIGGSLTGPYSLAASSGAQRATQTVACLLAGLGEGVPGGVVVVPALRSAHEDRWREAYQAAGAGDLDSLRRVDPDFVSNEAQSLATGLVTIFSMLPQEGRALAVGHSPTNEAAVYGLTRTLVPPLGKGEGIVITEEGGAYSVVHDG
jgi:broad specificity phosphatase PhoE